MPMELGTGGFARRTSHGIEALVASVTKAKDHPERIAFLTAADLASWARVFGWKRVTHVVEPLITPLLIGEALRSPERRSQNFALSGGLLAGGVASFEQARVPATSSALGVAGVVANQAGFASRLVDKRAAVSTTGAAVAGGVLAAGIGLAAWKNKKLVPATAIGGAATLATAALANDERFQNSTTANAGIGHGANLIVAAEGARLVRNTLLKGKTGFGARALEALTVGAQAIGQMMLTDGVAKN